MKYLFILVPAAISVRLASGFVLTASGRGSTWLTPTTTRSTTRIHSSPAKEDSINDENVLATARQDDNQVPLQAIGSVGFLIPQREHDQQRKTKFGRAAPVEPPTIMEAVSQLARKCFCFADGRVDTLIAPCGVPSSAAVTKTTSSDSVRQQLLEIDVLIAVGLTEDSDLDFCEQLFQDRLVRNREINEHHRQCQFAVDCSKTFPTFVGSYEENSPNLESRFLPWTKAATSRRLAVQMKNLFQKWSSDEFVFGILIFLNEFSGSRVDWVKHSIDATWEKGPVQNARELYSMVSKCGDCIVNCVKDDTCRECLSTLTAVDTRDQVASYRTIVSYESDLLRDFSFCILQKNNIFECSASIPKLPEVTPLSTFRGEPLTQDIARALLVGHLDDESATLDGSLKTDVSWIVTCGANEAYDKFPSQNQLFYPTARGDGNLWYDPVFRVETLDGRHVWCKRHYRVRPQKVPGTFRFSVLDNGITSDEFWTIVAVAEEDLSWIVFHYAGAAAAVGQRYLGGLLCTPDGRLPPEKELTKVWTAVQAAGIQPWELYCVDNDKKSPGYIAAGPPPLDYYRKEVLAKRSTSPSG
ncbi:hypothetical protein ACA910_015958 [Epithemia clementina (nom. ined.)]